MTTPRMGTWAIVVCAVMFAAGAMVLKDQRKHIVLCDATLHPVACQIMQHGCYVWHDGFEQCPKRYTDKVTP